MNFLKKNKSIIIAVIIFLGLVLLGVKVKNFLIPNEGAAVYGNRLEGKIAITKDIDSKIKDALSTGVKKVTVRDAGRIINVTITVNDDVSKTDAKNYAAKAMESFTKEEQDYYDIQFFMIKDNKESTDFPIIGYSIRTSKEIKWTKDR